ncbi:hydroxyisourate hydrolase [Paucibacter sp. KCTC 42545]|uniref:hydroxyisourate hydrolase n=1 Tax=Paucibacter sp. KCTC 42545 TaxID=1768242 RepID=UPI000733AB9A|nr:hydroxyisourate hydrolase [Paucibacter sp. KCTC 42545]ALT75927.1 5-hydroxyisourate hydrolase [Paucibacter sp. KCTC 42545]
MRPQLIASVLFVAAMTGMAPPALAADPNPLSVHVLDLQTGQPSPGIQVDLERRAASGNWQPLGSGTTDEQGRIRALVPAAALNEWAAGDYRVVFRTGEFYARQKQPSFFPEIPVVFRVESAKQHYHVPLLLSPFGFSTYRGN